MSDDPFAEHDDAEEEYEDPSPSAVDDKAQRRIRDKAKREVAEEEAFWRATLSSPAGRRAIWKTIDALGPFQKRFATGPNGFPQESATWFYYGQQQAGMAYLRLMMKTDLGGTVLMMKENDPYLAEPPKRPRRRRQQ